MTAPMFSIIVPTFNSAATLQGCIESLTCQTYNDYELVLVDGASTDRTLEIANSFGAGFGDRLVIHSGPDEGPYDAMNRGVGMASGEWLLFLGSDDTLLEPATLELVAAFIRGHEPSDLVYGDVVMRSTGSRHAGAFDLDRLLFETNLCHQSIFY
ncbi:glycosyltransferase, partial [Mycobacterium intracellulare subsp. intracellulare]|nr:glycosyltransferase [Mycobacterium intracellulare subsp. intracellulare]MDS0336291.1 glycosyltransferase [Mycobacterium intracellulare]